MQQYMAWFNAFDYEKNKKHSSFTLETFNIILYFCRKKIVCTNEYKN